MPGKRRVYIVDDDAAVRDSLSLLLESQGYSPRGFVSAAAFLDAAGSLAAGCVIVDIRMPGMDGLEMQRQLIARALDFPLIVVTGHGDVPAAVQAMKAGAVDFIEKPFASEAILRSLETAFARLAAHEPRDPAHAAAAAKLALLSGRERQVLDGLLAGLPNKSIAYDLGISPRTVEIHRARLMDKTGARNLSELIRLGLAAGLAPDAKQ